MNRFLEALAEICREHPLREKWVLAPNTRSGHQWLESLARSGIPVVNLHVKTLRALARDLAAPAMREKQIRLLSRLGQAILAELVWERFARTGGGYLKNLTPTPRLFERLASTLVEIRCAGLVSSDLDPGSFEVPLKGRELAEFLRLWGEELGRIGKTDYGGVLKLAVDRLRGDPAALPGGALALIPEDLAVQGLEKELLAAIPSGQSHTLAVEGPDSPHPSLSLTFFRAWGEINEAREALRRCLEAGTPLDTVEFIVSDPETYVPILHELFESRFWDRTSGRESAPRITFADGIPASYSRPARALALWLQWIHEGFPQPLLVRMLEDGLIRLPDKLQGPGVTGRLAKCLRGLPIARGRDRYLPVIERQLAALRKRMEDPVAARSEEGEARLRDWTRMLAETEALKSVMGELLEVSASLSDTPLRVIECARAFLTSIGHPEDRPGNELDNFARKEFLEEIDELDEWFRDGHPLPDFNGWDWLAGLPERTRLQGSRPREGMLHVSSFAGGGHSGREHIFILGLDDTRFPGVGIQDPLLLDGERRRLSGEILTSGDRLHSRVKAFGHLLARQRGQVTLSYCCRSVVEERELFPSSVFSELFEVQAGPDRASLPTTSFTPSSPQRALHLGEWWLQRLEGREGQIGALGSVSARYPHLGRGLSARAARASDRFTEFDGRVSSFGGGMEDPTTPTGPALSASALQTVGQCPLQYFFRQVLRIEPPEDFEEDPARWLDPLDFGSLLHEVFHRFMGHLQDRAEEPSRRMHGDLLVEILSKTVKRYRDTIPPPSESAYKDQVRELEQAAHIFLVEEEEFRRTSTPVYLEASIGMRPGDPPTALDSPEPVSLTLDGGLAIRVRGRIDRVDRLPSGHYAIWDYKTGSATIYRKKDPFREGRLVQHALYIDLVRARLREILGSEAAISSFGYFFPSAREHGERISWTPEDLQGGAGVVSRLVRLIAGGSFVPTENKDDCTHCDYRAACGDLELSAHRAARKIKNPGNPELEPMRELRGLDEDCDAPSS